MKLIRKLSFEKNKNNITISYGIFLCPYCLKKVKKQLSNGLKAKSCGCNQYPIKHGKSETKVYECWLNMKQRILNPNKKCYKNYGGRGITICDEWLEYIPFRDWALSNGYQEDLEIDRIDTDGNYKPTNCHFVTTKENIRNRKYNKIKSLEIANVIRYLDSTGKYTQKQLAEKYNVTPQTISYIINNKQWKN